MFYVVADTETGGTNPRENALLTAAFLVLDGETLEQQEWLEILLEPDLERYSVTDRAMEINGIDLNELGRAGLSYEEAKRRILATLDRYDSRKLLVGWNVGTFDGEFIREQLLGADAFSRQFGYRTVDLHAVMATLAAAGKMPYTKSLEATARYFGVLGSDEKQAHGALEDAVITADVFRALVKLMR